MKVAKSKKKKIQFKPLSSSEINKVCLAIFLGNFFMHFEFNCCSECFNHCPFYHQSPRSLSLGYFALLPAVLFKCGLDLKLRSLNSMRLLWSNWGWWYCPYHLVCIAYMFEKDRLIILLIIRSFGSWYMLIHSTCGCDMLKVITINEPIRMSKYYQGRRAPSRSLAFSYIHNILVGYPPLINIKR